jgi:hypothetical protein
VAKKKSELTPVIRFAPIGELNFYIVSEEELEALGRGSLGSIYLNMALALLPVSVAFLLTLLSTEIKSNGVLFAFISGAIVCFVAGGICLVLAYFNHTSTAAMVKRIKGRMPPPPPLDDDQATASPPSPAPSGPPPTPPASPPGGPQGAP